MADAEDIDTEAAANALRPKESAAGSHKIVEHSLGDQVKLAEHLRKVSDADTAATAGAAGGFGLRFLKTVPPGAG